MRRIADLYPGDAKTDAKDAARTMPHTLRSLEPTDEITAELTVLVGFNPDLATGATRTSNRIRGLLTKSHPRLERVSRARYSQTGTPGSASGREKRTGGNTGTALLAGSAGTPRMTTGRSHQARTSQQRLGVGPEPEGSRFSELERLRRPSTRTTGTAFARALERVDEIGAYRLGRLRLSQIPPNRMAALAPYALGSKAPLLKRAPEPKRTAMLTAVMRHLEAKAIDEAPDLFQVLVATRLLNTAKRKTEKERLSMLPQLEKASRVLARAAKVLFEELELVEEHGADLDVAALWAAVEEAAPRAAVLTAAATVVSLVPEDKGSAEVAMRAALANRYATVRPFLALLGESKALDVASAGRRVLAGARGLPEQQVRQVDLRERLLDPPSQPGQGLRLAEGAEPRDVQLHPPVAGLLDGDLRRGERLDRLPRRLRPPR
ncbi:hypothetical protein SUDANB178_06416 [Streptomyces sp. enrichment culture]